MHTDVFFCVTSIKYDSIVFYIWYSEDRFDLVAMNIGNVESCVFVFLLRIYFHVFLTSLDNYFWVVFQRFDSVLLLGKRFICIENEQLFLSLSHWSAADGQINTSLKIFFTAYKFHRGLYYTLRGEPKILNTKNSCSRDTWYSFW